MAQRGMCVTCLPFDVRREYVPGSASGYVGRTRINRPPNAPCGTGRRFPPLASTTAASVWPVVMETKWCSEWKEKEAKVHKEAFRYGRSASDGGQLKGRRLVGAGPRLFARRRRAAHPSAYL